MNKANVERPDYGIDAPGVICNLLIFASIGLACWASAKLAYWSGHLLVPVGQGDVDFSLAGTGLAMGLGMSFTALWMLWDSKIGKIRGREYMLQRLHWTGDEQVLDIGCGRGLLLNAAARRLTTGKATGIDLWQSEDLSSNSPEATLENAHREGVADKVNIQTCDMRKLPFGDGSFDYVISRAAIHNLYDAEDRAKAIAEIARVLKPGGQALIDDIRHGKEYAASFTKNGCSDIQFVGSKLASWLATLLSFGSLWPDVLWVKKAK
ncbi:class I SAM-dependent methyltransferase [Undibacterium sp. TJN19]|uniref:class I SAM-dependent methyltransferase n=1 Tax=Undibacterium sp. TJN19 TaxID=3413055 RepID=UPI003BF17213